MGGCPTLDALSDGAAIGHLSTRVGRQPTDDISAYLTISAGTRAVAPARATPVETEEGEDIDPSVAIDASVAVEAGEVYLGMPAAEILERRLGRVPEGVVYLAAGAAHDANAASAYGADIGLPGQRARRRRRAAGGHRQRRPGRRGTAGPGRRPAVRSRGGRRR